MQGGGKGGKEIDWRIGLSAELREWPSSLHGVEEWPEDDGHRAGSSGVEPALVCACEGYVREFGTGQSVASMMETKSWPLFEDDLYQWHYRDRFVREGWPHLHFMPAEPGDSPVVITCEKPPQAAPTGASPSSGSVSHLRALIRSKRGEQRVLVSVADVEAADGRLTPVLQSLVPSLPSGPVPLLVYSESEYFAAELVRYEVQTIRRVHKIGVLVTRAGQLEEDQWYNNCGQSAELEAFLDLLGERVRLLGFDAYRGGLDVKADTTGTHSVYTKHSDCEIMFHVSTLLAYHAADLQQVERKRHLGNDVVMVIFRESHDAPFDPREIHSQFNHVFLVVTPCRTDDGAPGYALEIIMKGGVHPFGPPLPARSVFPHGDAFRRWLLAKIINAERAAFYAPDFVVKFRTTRKTQLEQIVLNCPELGKKERRATRSALSMRGMAARTTSFVNRASTLRHPKKPASSSTDEEGDEDVVIGGPSHFRHVAHGESGLISIVSGGGGPSKPSASVERTRAGTSTDSSPSGSPASHPALISPLSIPSHPVSLSIAEDEASPSKTRSMSARSQPAAPPPSVPQRLTPEQMQVRTATIRRKVPPPRPSIDMPKDLPTPPSQLPPSQEPPPPTSPHRPPPSSSGSEETESRWASLMSSTAAGAPGPRRVIKRRVPIAARPAHSELPEAPKSLPPVPPSLDHESADDTSPSRAHESPLL